MSDARKCAFNAVVDKRTSVVVLGSLPGDISLARQQYYANPTNQFWRLIGRVIECNLTALPYDDRLAALLEARVGLWDVIATAQRRGSADGAIRNAQARSLQDFADALPELRALAFNGGKAAAVGRKQLSVPPRHAIVELPSSSAAYCSVSFDQKASVWLSLRQFLTD